MSLGGEVRDKRERFISLAETRTEKAMRAIRLLENLANRANYDFESSELDQIVRALEGEIKNLKVVYARASDSGRGSFRLRRTESD